MFYLTAFLKKKIMILILLLIYPFRCSSSNTLYVNHDNTKLSPYTTKSQKTFEDCQHFCLKDLKKNCSNSKKIILSCFNLKKRNFNRFKKLKCFQTSQKNHVFFVLSSKKIQQKCLKKIFSCFRKYLRNTKIDLYLLCKEDQYRSVNDDRYQKIFSNKLNDKKSTQQNYIKSHVSKKKNKKKQLVIMIDPGHGGEDPGAIGKYGTLEKNVSLSISKNLNKLINSDKKMKSYMTRKEDKFISLNERLSKTYQTKANLLVSIHANSCRNRNAVGSSVFVSSFNDRRSFYSNNILKDYFYFKNQKVNRNQTIKLKTIQDSFKLGNFILKKISKINKLHKREVETANFIILGIPEIPSVLVETAFISNIEEEKKLNKLQFQKKIAESIFQGIKIYSETNLKNL
ncbi:hypothetical protein AOQ87_01040 [Candidatus Riesia pediculischaeffi]|uniref:N-acetylmuramoyl-L-alanine amidase n=2 Tax=Candidatus Riesia pediculischaeffi TaxID=428411 RepID=A0A1V0HKB4_9ENTR|nr:hypothetical protein AOQ87_01040 [Candidatus Riesia pediculischaeffi]